MKRREILEEVWRSATTKSRNKCVAQAEAELEKLELTKEELAKLLTFELESGPWMLMSTYLNSGDIVDLAQAIHQAGREKREK